MNKQLRNASPKQQGITFWHILIMVVIAVSLAVCGKKGTIPFIQTEAPIIGKLHLPTMPDMPTFPRFNQRTQTSTTEPSYYAPQPEPIESESLFIEQGATRVAQPSTTTGYDTQFPRDLPGNLSQGYYTVQVFSGYNSKNAFDLERALKKDGYRAYVEQFTDNRGILFKVRIGRYTNRADAFAMNSKIRMSYPKQLSKSYVLLKH